MKKNIYTFVFILFHLNFSINLAQEEDYESISLTADDHAILESLNQNFIQAVKNNDLIATQQLISQGVNINHQDERGNTAAHYAWSADTNYGKIRGTLATAQANLDIPNTDNKTANDFIGEIRLPFINMNANEIADSLKNMRMRNKALLAQHKIEAEANTNEEFANFIMNRSFTYEQFNKMIKALEQGNITEFMQRHMNQS